MEKLKKKIILILLLSLILLLPSCTSKPQGGSVTLADMAGNIDEVAEQKSLQFKEENKEKFDKHYSGNLYYEDFSEEAKLINEAYGERKIKELKYPYEEENLGKYLEYFMKPNVECYNLSLKKLRDGEITIDDILEDEEEHIRSISLDFYYFREEKFRFLEFSSDFKRMRDSYREKDVPFEVVVRGYLKSKLRQFSFEWLKKMDKPFIFLEDSYSKFTNEYYTTEGEKFGKIYEDEKIKSLRTLKDRYNEEFIAIHERLESEGFYQVYSPVNDMSIKFDVETIYGNKYACVMAQKMVTKTVNKIIKSKGYEDRIVVFSTVEYVPDNHSEEFNLKVDFNNIKTEEDEVKFINEIFPQSMQTTLYYLFTEDEEIDYKGIKEVVEEYQEIYPNKEDDINSVFIYLIKISEENRKIAVDLFKDKDSTEGYFIKRNPGIDLANQFIVRTDHEGFRFLDVYGEQLDFMYWITKPSKDLTVQEFIQRERRNGIWRD